MLKIYMLGNFYVERDGTPIPAVDWARRKTRSLLKVLALQPGHRLHREQITEMLWPDLDPSLPRQLLSQPIIPPPTPWSRVSSVPQVLTI